MKIRLLFTLFLFSFLIHAQDHELWDALLQKHVTSNGKVDYKGFIEDQTEVTKYLKSLSENPPLQKWSTDRKKAYLINAYNAFTVQLIIDNYPVRSIKDIGGLFSSPFKKDFIQLGSEVYSLDNIEKDMLLKMGDERVHFGINCASYSCPKLHNRAFTADNVDELLDELASAFINDKELNSLTPNQVELSKIFKWYTSDFENENQNLIDYINKFSEIHINDDANISFKAYNWELNEK